MNHTNDNIRFTSVEFKKYKAFSRYSVALSDFNVLVGPNNCGKSTVIGAFTALHAGIRRARAFSPDRAPDNQGRDYGYTLSTDSIPISLENVHTDYGEDDTEVTFRLSNGNKLQLLFPKDGGIILFPLSDTVTIKSPREFRTHYPVSIASVPILGPVEHNEEFVQSATVQRELYTHRASRHFRNYWHYFPEGFEDFAELVRTTWPGMDILPPEQPDYFQNKISMFCLENRITRELYWAGYGFQIWCQLLTQISRAKNASILVIDEPEIYLHPDVQRQLYGILKTVGPDVLIATHSTEIISEVEPSDILIVDKRLRSAKRLSDIEEVQSAIDSIGSIQNITLTKLAQNRRVVFVEDEKDFLIIRRFAKILGFDEISASIGVTAVKSEGVGNWKSVKSVGWGIERALGKKLKIAAIYDRDYYCQEELDNIQSSLNQHLQLVHFHALKEIENYLLMPKVLERACEKAIKDRDRRTGEKTEDSVPVIEWLDEISNDLKTDILAQYGAKRSEFYRSKGVDPSESIAEASKWVEDQWSNIEKRMKIVPGKKIIKKFRTLVQNNFHITLTNIRIINSCSRDDIPSDLVMLIKKLDQFRNLL